MALPASYETKEAAPESIREHLVERDGKFVVEVEGMKSKVDFDTYSEALKKRLADATAKLEAAKGGMTREEILDAIKDASRDMNRGKDGDKGDNSQHVADLEREVASLKEKLGNLTAERDGLDTKLRDVTINTALTTAVAEAQPLPTSVEPITRLLSSEFERSESGDVRSKIDCEFGPNLTPAEVLSKVKTDPRYKPLWPASKGGGAGGGDGSGGGAGGDGDNPWSRKHWNRTKQTQIQAADLDKAKKLAKAAGSELGARRPPEK